MYIYPDNLAAKATLWLWELKDLAIIGIGFLIGIFSLVRTGALLPLARVVAYGFLNHSKSCDEIFPVIYCDEKVNFDNLLIRLTDNIEKGEPQVLPEMMLFHVLRGTLKHRSWSYEAEWRCIRVGAYGEADFVPKIKSVYLGSKFDKANISDIEDIARERDFNVYQLSSTSFTQQRYSFNSTPVFEHNTVEI